jgi:hypothetical protein
VEAHVTSLMEVIFTGSSYRSGFPFISPLSTSGETSVISVILEEGFSFSIDLLLLGIDVIILRRNLTTVATKRIHSLL